MKAINPSMAMVKVDPKVIKFGAIFIGGLVLFFIVTRQVKKLIDRPYGERAQEKELKNIPVDPANVTLSEGSATLIMQNLFNAMNKYGVDTEALIRNLESLKTKDDLLLIIRMFGIRPYSGSKLTVTEIRKKLGGSRDLNLNGWLAAELSGWYYGKTRKKVVEIYQRLGVIF